MAATRFVAEALGCVVTVSVPYSSGQWLQPMRRLSRMTHCLYCFSPLFIGSMAATIGKIHEQVADSMFQSPIHRVNGCNGYWFCSNMDDEEGFSPLFIGSMAATRGE